MNEFAHMFTGPYQFPPIELTVFMGPAEWDELLNDLRAVERQCGANRNDCAAVLISICIDNKIDTMRLILDVLGPFGYDRAHIAIIVKSWTGRNPDRHRWTVDSAGKYHTIH